MKLSDPGRKFLFFLLVNLLVHLPFLNLPPCGAHVWRQCNTLAMARNFATENMNILEPRIDRRNETDGVTGSHFPLYEWGLAAVSKVFGFTDLLPRLYSLLISSLGMLAFYLVLLRLKTSFFAATCGALLLLSLPQIYYDSINAMPDILALTLSIFALYYFLGYFMEETSRLLVTAILFSVAGGLIKFQFLIIPFASIAYMRFNRRQVTGILCAVLCVVLPIIWWYHHALVMTNLHNLKEFGLWIQPVTAGEKYQTVFNNLFSDLPELLAGWPLLIALIVFAFIKARRPVFDRETILLSVWTGSFAIFYGIAIERMMHHSYYFMAFLPVLIIWFLRLTNGLKNTKPILIIVLLLNFTWAFARIIPSRWTYTKMNIPREFIDKTQRAKLADCIPQGAKCVVGPDISGCIYFYFTNTKGYSFERPDELLQQKSDGMYCDVMRKDGVKFLVCNHHELMEPVLAKLGRIRLKETVGEFEVWELY